MKKITLKEAKRLSIIKWKDLAETGEKKLSPSVGEKLQHVFLRCGFCEYHHQKNLGCSQCPLNTDDSLGCCGGLYKLWSDSVIVADRKKYAKQILALIESIETAWFHDMYYRLRGKLFLLFN